jgi:hypothetical protein
MLMGCEDTDTEMEMRMEDGGFDLCGGAAAGVLLGEGSLAYRYGYTVLRCCVVLVYDFVGSSYRVVFPALECIPLLLNSLSLKLWYLTPKLSSSARHIPHTVSS